MCGIFGVIAAPSAKFSPNRFKNTVNQLFLLSESRGKEASGIGLYYQKKTRIYKEPFRSRDFIRCRIYNTILDDAAQCLRHNVPIVVLGHTRLATNGPQRENDNNNPIKTHEIIGVHNGIVVNADALWEHYFSVGRTSQVDSEVLFALLDDLTQKGFSPQESLSWIFSHIEGSASIAALLMNRQETVFATNTGSLYLCSNREKDIFLCASESTTLRAVLRKQRLERHPGEFAMFQLKPSQAYLFDIKHNVQSFLFLNPSQSVQKECAFEEKFS
ncbi:MAG: hypothetical protein JXD21_00645 [Candidatus Omnitrophica bacterium]|nr:hypothetical protein [Candidatus Omnitrophota bacterium]